MFLVMLINSLFLFQRRGNKETVEGKDSCKTNTLLCRFVLDGTGQKIGESIAVNDDMMIIKSGKKYLGVPLKHISEDGKSILVKGLVDLCKAEEIGEQWRKTSFRDMDQSCMHNEGKKDGF